MSDRKTTIRRRIIKAMPRSILDEQFTTDERPWGSDRANIETRVLLKWDSEMCDEFLEWLRDHS